VLLIYHFGVNCALTHVALYEWQCVKFCLNLAAINYVTIDTGSFVASFKSTLTGGTHIHNAIRALLLYWENDVMTRKRFRPVFPEILALSWLTESHHCFPSVRQKQPSASLRKVGHFIPSWFSSDVSCDVSTGWFTK